MIKRNNKLFYIIIKPFVKLKFLLKYHPVIIGKENIPETGGIILCGNHRHKDDQYNVLIITKRMVRYMAKDEYFKGKMAWFYRGAGCIPVYRFSADEKMKNETKSEAENVLNNKEALGIFPEGTRNDVLSKQDKIDELYRIVKEKMTLGELLNIIKDKNIRYTQIDYLKELEKSNIITADELVDYVLNPDESLIKLLNENKITKDEYKESLLLPFKFGAVSLASKTNSLIVPFATTGEYNGRRNQLITRIGKPFSVKDMDLESANKLLKEKIIELM